MIDPTCKPANSPNFHQTDPCLRDCTGHHYIQHVMLYYLAVRHAGYRHGDGSSYIGFLIKSLSSFLTHCWSAFDETVRDTFEYFILIIKISTLMP